MNDRLIIKAHVIVDDVMRSLWRESHVLAQLSDSEVLTVAVAAAKLFHNNHESTLGMLTEASYLSGRLSASRFNHRLHALSG